MLLELLLLLVLLTLTIHFYLRWRNKQQLLNIPIVSNIPVIGSLIELWSFQPDNLHLKFQEFVSRFGKSFSACVFGTLVVVTADTRYVDDLLSSHKHIHKHLLYLLLRSWLGDGLLLSHGQKWQSMRKIITPTFHFKILEQFVEVFDCQSTVFIEKLRPFANGTTIIDVYPHVGLLTLDIIAETAMGVRINAQVDSKSDFVQAVKDVTNILATRFIRPHLVFPWIFRMLTPKLCKKQNEGIATMHKFTENIIQKRRKTLETTDVKRSKVTDGDDIGIKERMALLDVLLQSTIDSEPLTDTQIRDEVNTFMFEGHDTTTSAVSFSLYLLSRHVECQKKLYEEIHAHFGDDLERKITYRDLQNLTYLNCIVKEALRLYPPIPAIGRWLKEDLKLVDVTLPAGTNIIVLLWQILRDPEVFTEPERYWPERHLEENPRSTNAFTNIPFSAGPRNCVGQRFALFEIKTIIIKMLRNYELLALGATVQPSIKIVLRSRTGINFGLRPRTY